MKRKVNLSFVSVLVVILFGMCFLSYSAKPGEGTEKEETSVQETVRDFNTMYKELDAETRQLLEKPVTLIFNRGKATHILRAISQQTGVKIMAVTLEDRIDLLLQDVPAREALETISKDHDWIWEANGHTLYVYPASCRGASKAVDRFFQELDPELRKRLAKPVTLIVNAIRIDQAFSILSRQTGISFRLENLSGRVSFIAQKQPGDDVLGILARGYAWKLGTDQDMITVAPFRSASDSKEKNEKNPSNQIKVITPETEIKTPSSPKRELTDEEKEKIRQHRERVQKILEQKNKEIRERHKPE